MKDKKFNTSDLDIMLSDIKKSNRNRLTAGREEDLATIKNNPKFQKLDSICKKYGYMLHVAVKKSYGTVMEIVAPRENDYLPDIYFDGSSFQYGNNPGFSIQTTSYGALDINEYKKYVAGVISAYKCVDELSKEDLNDLPEID
jgi:hypothetical protein